MELRDAQPVDKTLFVVVCEIFLEDTSNKQFTEQRRYALTNMSRHHPVS